jgi:hypothetical protein
MVWKITDLRISQNLPTAFYQSISGPTYQAQNMETEADISITFRDFDANISTLEDFEEQMKNSEMVFENNQFNKEEILIALQEQYPERFI